MPDPRNVLFISSGDHEEDARTAAMIRRNIANEAEGLCPNGCAPLVWPDRDDVAECPNCGCILVGHMRSKYDPQYRGDDAKKGKVSE